MRKFGVGLAVVLGVAGCAGSGAKPRHYQGGDAEGAPRLETLPSLDVAQNELTTEMKMARMLSAECLNLAPPRRPVETSSTAMEQWSDAELKEWMRSKNARAEAARKELDLAAGQNHRQRIMAGAIVGLVYEDVARNLLALPVPAELSSEPEIAAMYVDLLKTQAAPYLVQARQAYAACSGNANQLDELRHWSDFCLSREELLPPVGLEAAPAHGASETRVSISRN